MNGKEWKALVFAHSRDVYQNVFAVFPRLSLHLLRINFILLALFPHSAAAAAAAKPFSNFTDGLFL